MRTRVLNSLVCPNTGNTKFEIFAVELKRGDEMLANVKFKDILDTDDVKEGIIADLKGNVVYPISDYVGSVLSDEDAHQGHYNDLLNRLSESAPAAYKKAIKASLARLATAKHTHDGEWNREEMEYYDADVATTEKRAEFLETIKAKPLWHIFIERKRHLMDRVTLGQGSRVLEIGCGNARTMAKIAPPSEKGFEYTGIDIAWKRLVLAKQVMPEGDFLQASALNLPFAENAFDVSVAFGSLHHLPNRESGFMEAIRITKETGHILINEPIDKPQFIDEDKHPKLRSLIEEYEHSEHDNDINVEEFREIIAREKLDLQHEYFNGSVLRTLMTFGWIKKIPVYSTKTWWRFLIWLDRGFIKAFCRKHSVLGPSGAYMVIQKPKKA
jgi:ubiquinone/menaquinone biosynthesis C-methylase UbiE